MKRSKIMMAVAAVGLAATGCVPMADVSLGCYDDGYGVAPGYVNISGPLPIAVTSPFFYPAPAAPVYGGPAFVPAPAPPAPRPVAPPAPGPAGRPPLRPQPR